MINPNEPAFPDPIRSKEQSFSIQDPWEYPQGLTIRQHMAIQFMASRLQLWCIHITLDEECAELCAKETILAVDALIAELNKTVTE